MIARQLLFLFSALGAANGILMAAWFFSRRPRRLAGCMLGSLLLAVGVRTGKSAFLYFNPIIALEFRQLGLSACLLIGPLTYLYARYHLAERSGQPARVRWEWHLGACLLLIGLGLAFPYTDYRYAWDRSSAGIHLFWLCYLVAAGRAIWLERARLCEPGRRIPPESLLLASVFLGSCLILAAYATVAFTSYIVGALSFTFTLHIAAIVLVLRPHETGTAEKYGERKLNEDDTLALVASLEKLMREDKLYLNPNLNINLLARRAAYPQALVSQALNDRLKKTFHLYVNEYRIAEAKRLLIELPELNLESIAERSGFNSNSTFFAAFKKISGCTPASFRAGALPPEALRNRDSGVRSSA